LFGGCSEPEVAPCEDCPRFVYDGLEREYFLHKPDNLPTNAPLVFLLHGYGGGIVGLRDSDMNALADEHGFAVCYPQGALDDSEIHHWNARLEISDVDDIGFLTALAQELQNMHALSPERTFICGISNGGFMSYTMACEAPEVFAAAGSIIGSMSGYSWENRAATTSAVPILQISGVADDIVPIDGSMSTEGGWGGAPHMDQIIEYWADFNECTAIDTLTISSHTTAYHHTGGINGNEVWYYKIEEFGHEWPDNSNIAGFNTSEKLWEFFSRF